MKQVQFKIVKKHCKGCVAVREAKAGCFLTAWSMSEKLPWICRSTSGVGRGDVAFRQLGCLDPGCKARAIVRLDAIREFVGTLDTSIKRGKKQSKSGAA
jgi:hypothetical protein